MTACQNHDPLFAVVDAMLSNMAQPARAVGEGIICSLLQGTST